MTPDDVITRITEAPTDADALAIIATVPALTVCAMADQLHIDADFRGIRWLRGAVVSEARS